MNDIFAAPDQDVRSGPAIDVYAFCLPKKPDPHTKAKVLGRERSHRANIHGVERVIVVEQSARINGESSMAAAVDEAGPRPVAVDVERRRVQAVRPS